MGVLLCAARMFAVVLAAWSISSLLGWKLWISCVLVMLWFLLALWGRLPWGGSEWIPPRWVLIVCMCLSVESVLSLIARWCMPSALSLRWSAGW